MTEAVNGCHQSTAATSQQLPAVNGCHHSTTAPHTAAMTVTAAPSLVYSDMVEEDIEPVVAFMGEHFYPREPLSIGLKITWEDNNEWVLSSMKSWLPSGVSVVARDASTGTIAGTIVSTILTKNNNTSFDSALSSPKTKVKRLHAVLSILEDSVDLFERFPVDKILELAMITVSDQYGRRGVGRRLVQESERRGQALGCRACTSQATASGSQCLLQRLGYETLYEMDYSSFTYAGESVLDLDSMLGCTSAKVMARWLEPATPPITNKPVHLEGSTGFASLQKKQECPNREEGKSHEEQDSGHKEQNCGHKQQDNGHNQQNGDHKKQNGSHKQQDNGHKQQNDDHKEQNEGHKEQNDDHKEQDEGHKEQNGSYKQQDNGHNQQNGDHKEQNEGHKKQNDDHKEQDEGHKEQNGDHKEQDDGHKEQNGDHKEQDDGHKEQNSDHKDQDDGHKKQNGSHKEQVVHKEQDNGHTNSGESRESQDENRQLSDDKNEVPRNGHVHADDSLKSKDDP